MLEDVVAIKRYAAGVYMRLEDPQALRNWLAARHMSYADLAILVGVSKQFIHKLASGQKTTCTPAVAQKIELVLLPPREQWHPNDRPLFIPKNAPILRPVKRGQKITMPLEHHFMTFVDKREPKECWPWTGSILTSGYGQYRIGQSRHVAHRVSYELFVGPIPEGMQIDHVAQRGCNMRACVNPAHLEPVTASENCQRGVAQNGIGFEATGVCSNGHDVAEVGAYRWPSAATGWRCAQCERDRARERYALAKQKRLANPSVSKLAVDKAPVLSEGAATLQT